MNDIERAIDVQQKLIKKWENRAKELEEVIEKHPWEKMGYESADWRESELKRRKEQILTALITIDALKKQTPKEIIYDYGLNETRCPRCNTIFGYAYEEDETEDMYYAPYCYECGQCLDWEIENE